MAFQGDRSVLVPALTAIRPLLVVEVEYPELPSRSYQIILTAEHIHFALVHNGGVIPERPRNLVRAIWILVIRALVDKRPMEGLSG